MSSIRAAPAGCRCSALLVLVAALLMAAVTYRSVLGETEALFDYQLQQMALSLRDQGEIAAGPGRHAAPTSSSTSWSRSGPSTAAASTRRAAHASLPARALLGFADVNVDGRAWRTFSVATRDAVIQVAQPVRDPAARSPRSAACAASLPLLLMAPVLALAIWWLAAQTLRAAAARWRASVRSRDADRWTPLPTGGLPDEVAPLVRALNACCARLRARSTRSARSSPMPRTSCARR